MGRGRQGRGLYCVPLMCVQADASMWYQGEDGTPYIASESEAQRSIGSMWKEILFKRHPEGHRGGRPVAVIFEPPSHLICEVVTPTGPMDQRFYERVLHIDGVEMMPGDERTIGQMVDGSSDLHFLSTVDAMSDYMHLLWENKVPVGMDYWREFEVVFRCGISPKHITYMKPLSQRGYRYRRRTRAQGRALWSDE